LSRDGSEHTLFAAFTHYDGNYATALSSFINGSSCLHFHHSHR